jgi:hypothetical protein
MQGLECCKCLLRNARHQIRAQAQTHPAADRTRPKADRQRQTPRGRGRAFAREPNYPLPGACLRLRHGVMGCLDLRSSSLGRIPVLPTRCVRHRGPFGDEVGRSLQGYLVGQGPATLALTCLGCDFAALRYLLGRVGRSNPSPGGTWPPPSPLGEG